MSRFTRVIAYGCSFTAGDELCDHMFIPDSDKIKREQGFDKFHKQFWELPSEQTMLVQRLQREASWAGQVAKKLNIPIDNRAVGGSGIDHTLLAILKDLSDNKIEDTDLILIGTTSMNRALYFNPWTRNLLLSFPQHWPDDIRNHSHQYIQTIFSDINLIFKYYTTLYAIIKLAESSLFQNRMFIFNCYLKDYNDPKLIEHLEGDVPRTVIKLKQLCEQSKVYMHEKGMYDFFNLKPDFGEIDQAHGGGHPKVEVHQRFSDYIYGRLLGYQNNG